MKEKGKAIKSIIIGIVAIKLFGLIGVVAYIIFGEFIFKQLNKRIVAKDSIIEMKETRPALYKLLGAILYTIEGAVIVAAYFIGLIIYGIFFVK